VNSKRNFKLIFHKMLIKINISKKKYYDLHMYFIMEIFELSST